jgi:hypothetical protein
MATDDSHNQPSTTSRVEGSRGRVVSALTYSYTFLKLGGPWLALGFLGSGIAKTLLPSDAITAYSGIPYTLFPSP